MKKVILLLAVAMCGLLSYAQSNQVVWNNGRVQYAAPIASMDSLTYPVGNIVDADTLFMILPRHVKPDTIRIHDTIYIHDCKGNYNVLAGAFSVSATQQVRFASGNLQYIQSSDSWLFAKHQYDMLGVSNVFGDSVTYSADFGYSKEGQSISDRIDIFGWSANNATAPYGVSSSTNNDDYSGDFVDWGTAVGDGATWRTLSYDEWYYLFKTRDNASSLYGVARINLNTDGSEYVNGLIVLPDNWSCPTGVTFKSGVNNQDWHGVMINNGVQPFADYQTFTTTEWEVLETAGAVFLPTGGYRYGLDVSGVQGETSYWSSTSGKYLAFSSAIVTISSGNGRCHGESVRLVQNL